MGHLSIFLNDAANSFLKNAFIIHFRFVERRPRTTRFFKNQVKLSIFVWNGSCCLIQNHIPKKQNAMKLKFTHFPVIKNTIKRIAFKNAFDSSIIFQSFLYASIPAESTSYAPTFFHGSRNTARKIFVFSLLKLLKPNLQILMIIERNIRQ